MVSTSKGKHGLINKEEESPRQGEQKRRQSSTQESDHKSNNVLIARYEESPRQCVQMKVQSSIRKYMTQSMLIGQREEKGKAVDGRALSDLLLQQQDHQRVHDSINNCFLCESPQVTGTTTDDRRHPDELEEGSETSAPEKQRRLDSQSLSIPNTPECSPVSVSTTPSQVVPSTVNLSSVSQCILSPSHIMPCKSTPELAAKKEVHSKVPQV